MGLRLRAALAVAALAVVAPPASADTIVFRVETDIFRMNADGSGQRAVTHGEQRYEWPSAADDGTLVAADELGRLHRLARDGAALGPPIPTAATVATEDAPAETPTHVRISPDGTRIAYDQLIDGDPTTLWTPADATGLSFPGQALGQQGFISPSWIGNGRLILSRDVTSDAPGPIALYSVGGGDNAEEPWFADDAGDWASGFGAVASRDGTRIAVLADDAADSDGVPTRVTLRLFTAAGPGATPAFRCEIGLEAADTYALASPTFSPDGNRIAWAESDGIHAATLGPLADCGAIREQVLTLPGAWEPHWSPAARAGAARRSARREQAHAQRHHPRPSAAGDAAQARAARAGDDQRARLGPPVRPRRGQEEALRRHGHAQARQRRDDDGPRAPARERAEDREEARAARERPGSHAGRGHAAAALGGRARAASPHPPAETR